MQKSIISILLVLLVLTGCGIDKKTETFIKEYLTLRFEAVNMINEVDSDVFDLIEHTDMVKPYLSEKRYEEYNSNRESYNALANTNYQVEKGGTIEVESIKIEESNTNEYNYEVIAIINNPKEKLRATITGLLKIDDDGLIYYDWINKGPVIEKID